MDVNWLVKEVRGVTVRNLSCGTSSSSLSSPSKSNGAYIIPPSPRVEMLSLRDDSDEPRQLLFRSNAIDRSCNPSYLSMSLMAAVPLFDSSALHCTRLMLRFFDGENTNECLYQTVIDLNKVVCFGHLQLHSCSSLPVNTIMLSTDDGFYGTEALAHTLLSLNIITSMNKKDSTKPSSFSTDSGDGDGSSDPLILVDKIKRALADVRPLQQRAAQAVSGVSKDAKLAISSEVSRSRLEELLQEVESAEADVASEESLETMEANLLGTSKSLRHSIGVCEELSQSLLALSQQWQGRRDELLRNQFFFEARKIKLLSELQSIYPIEQSESGEYSIRGIELPMDLSQRDDEQISSALGYLVHLLLLASKYLDVPLRYQLLFFASRSMIRDPIQSSGAALPLYKRGIERERFDRALVWLQRDILQLLQSRKIPYNNKQSLLCNVSYLFVCEMCPAVC